MKETQNCKICGENNFKSFLTTKDYFYTGEEFNLSICQNCEFIFTNPIPDNLSRYYETEEYLSHHSHKKTIISRIYSFVRNLNLQRKYKVVTKYVSRGTIMDIGCGTGELLSFFKSKKWKTIGVEPDMEARKLAEKEHHITVFDEPHIKNIENNSLDVVSMWHVLEHVEDLNERVSDIKRIVKDDGIMVFALPNIKSPDAIKYGKFWAGLDVPRHLYHFSEKTFEQLLTKHGLKLIRSIPMKFDAYYVSMLSEKYKGSGLILLKAFFAGLNSNLKAKKDNNYSSMIFVVKKV